MADESKPMAHEPKLENEKAAAAAKGEEVSPPRKRQATATSNTSTNAEGNEDEAKPKVRDAFFQQPAPGARPPFLPCSRGLV